MDRSQETLEEVFSSLIKKTKSGHSLVISEFSQQYIVEVLCSFVTNTSILPGAIYPMDLFRQASSQEGMMRREVLRLCGDVSLFISGIFPDALASRRRAVSLGDYIDTGRAAYGLVGGVVFSELSDEFPQIVDLLNEVSVTIDLTNKDMKNYFNRRRQIDARITRR